MTDGTFFRIVHNSTILIWLYIYIKIKAKKKINLTFCISCSKIELQFSNFRFLNICRTYSYI